MKHIFRVTSPTVLLFILLVTASSTVAQTPTFTYQGRLTDGGTPANGPFDFQFTLWDAPSGGNQIPDGSPASTLTRNDVMVGNGIFSVQLDFGAGSFPGADRFIEISVRPGASTGPYTQLTPRQQLTSTPYAVRANSAASADTATTATNNVLKSGDTMTGELILFGNPTTSLGAATKQYVDGGLASKLNISGGIMSGPLDLGNNKITSLATPTNGTEAANKAYVDAAVSGGSGGFIWQEVTSTSHQAVPSRGYVANNAARVTITLPATPNIGDVVRVSGPGAGGWKIAQNAGQSIITIDLFGWVEQAIGVASEPEWTSVASSADGTKLVAVDHGPFVGPGGDIFVNDGSGFGVWTPAGLAEHWTSVASSADGTKLVAVVRDGLIYTSIDSGANWTPREADRAWVSVASSADGTKLVAVVENGKIYTSTDSGGNWIPREESRFWRSVASSSDGAKLVAVVYNGQIYTSTDSGVNWTARESDNQWSSVASSADGAKLVASGGGKIYTSTDSGANWTSRDTTSLVFVVASSADGSRLFAAPILNQIYTSTNSGLSWGERVVPNSFNCIASSSDGSKLIAAGGASGRIYTARFTTTVGTEGSLFGATGAAIELQYVGDGLWLPLTHVGRLW